MLLAQQNACIASIIKRLCNAPFFLEVVQSIAQIEAVHTSVTLSLDSDLRIAGASNSDALEALVLSRMQAAITAGHNIRLLLLVISRNMAYALSSSSLYLSRLLLTRIL